MSSEPPGPPPLPPQVQPSAPAPVRPTEPPMAPPRPPGLRARFAVKAAQWFSVPVLTSRRIWFAFSVAALTDAIQLALGPFGWVFVDEALDVVAMFLTCGALGFHMLLLPTFVLEFLPVTDMLPTWTGCTAAVVMLRKRAQGLPPPPPPASASG